ncbi:MAG: hypothetical protein AB1564_16015 [Chloroflexota bacterium]
MPQLAKGGKWVFGWVIVGQEREIRVPPEAWDEYGFQVQDEVLFMRGSRRSGGFGMGRQEVLSRSPILSRTWAKGTLTRRGMASLPQAVDVQPGERLLVARGSGLALGFLQRGPIYEEALKHPELEIFQV